MKKVVLSSVALAALATGSANAYDFNDKIYGKAHVDVGYSVQFFLNSLKDEIKSDKDNGADTNIISHYITVGGGYNIYYKANELIHPFAGAEIYGRIPVGGQKLIGYGGWNTYFTDFLHINGKLGTKINVCKNVAVAPYAVIGMNFSQYKLTVGDYSDKSTAIGLTTGAGVETIIQDQFTVGVEYRFGKTKTSSLLIDAGDFAFGEDSVRIKTHSVSLKFGYQFL